MLTGKAEWDEMKENALLATTFPAGGARIVEDEIVKLLRDNEHAELRIVGHSAGRILHAPLVQNLTNQGVIGKGPMGQSKG